MKAEDVDVLVRVYMGPCTSPQSARRLVHGALVKINARTVLVRLPGRKIIKRKIERDVHPDDRHMLRLAVSNG